MFDSKIDTYLIFSEENRLYFSQFETSSGCIILTPTEKVFITDFRYEAVAKERLDDFTVISTGNSKLIESIKTELKRLKSQVIGFEDDVLSHKAYKELKSELDEYTLKPAGNVFSQARLIKNADEIEKISTAQAIAQKSLAKVRSHIKPGLTEKEIAADLIYEMIINGADEPSFNTIVAIGENSARPHHKPTDKKIEKGDVVLIDFGARYKGYCSDMTRTFFLGEPSPRLKTIYDIVLNAQKYALSHIKAGMTGHEADSLAREFISANGFDEEFGHSLGHGVGINVHESPRLGKNSKDILMPEMVVTVEPGIYINGLGGVRIEDMIKITENGNINLTTFDKDMYI